jgi:hypothetical protein
MYQDITRCWFFKPGNEPETGRFSGSGRAQHREKLSICDLKTDMIDGMHFPIVPANFIEAYCNFHFLDFLPG